MKVFFYPLQVYFSFKNFIPLAFGKLKYTGINPLVLSLQLLEHAPMPPFPSINLTLGKVTYLLLFHISKYTPKIKRISTDNRIVPKNVEKVPSLVLKKIKHIGK